MLNGMPRRERAVMYKRDYNCCQAVAMTFADVLGMSEDEVARLASGFGGGMGRMREVCGCVSGALMVLGMARGYDDPEDNEAKKEHYALVREFADEFRKQNGSIICRELLEGVSTTPGGDPEARTDAYYKKRPCPDLVACAAEILDRML